MSDRFALSHNDRLNYQINQNAVSVSFGIPKSSGFKPNCVNHYLFAQDRMSWDADDAMRFRRFRWLDI
ncbi:hypothetical protein RA28_18805 [Ruegeria sp. ANG-S4]|nr:hypothetical protein RA28_18805 [Ruegeria sp. ANG-S4]